MGNYPIESSVAAKSKDAKNILPKYKTVEVLGVPVGVFTRAELTAMFLRILESQQCGWISYVNVHTINLVYSLDWFKKYLRDSILTYCDGQGVRVGAALLGKRIRERIVFSDWIYDVCAIADQTGSGIYLLGAEDIVLEKAKLTLLKFYPSLKISGSHHGYFTFQEVPSIVKLINHSGADILIVGMGMPKQEKWILETLINYNRDLLLTQVLVLTLSRVQKKDARLGWGKLVSNGCSGSCKSQEDYGKGIWWEIVCFCGFLLEIFLI